MADPNRRFRLAAITLQLLFLAMSGLARATTIFVDTTDDGSVASHCTLIDAVAAANTHTPQNACPAGTGNDTIKFSVTGTITLDGQLTTTDSLLAIIGPSSGGITIDGDGLGRIIDDESTVLTLQNLTFTNGADVHGGAIFTNHPNLEFAIRTFIKNTRPPAFTKNA